MRLSGKGSVISSSIIIRRGIIVKAYTSPINVFPFIGSKYLNAYSGNIKDTGKQKSFVHDNIYLITTSFVDAMTSKLSKMSLCICLAIILLLRYQSDEVTLYIPTLPGTLKKINSIL